MRDDRPQGPQYTNVEWVYLNDPDDPDLGWRPGYWLAENWDIAHWLMFADEEHSGSVELELYYSTYAGYPGTKTLFANPKIGGGFKNRSADMDGRVNERLSPGRYVQPKLITWTGFEWVSLTLELVRYR